MNNADMLEIVRTFQRAPREKLDRLIAEHRPGVDGRCPVCHTRGDCTLYFAAIAATVARRSNDTPPLEPA